MLTEVWRRRQSSAVAFAAVALHRGDDGLEEGGDDSVDSGMLRTPWGLVAPSLMLSTLHQRHKGSATGIRSHEDLNTR